MWCSVAYCSIIIFNLTFSRFISLHTLSVRFELNRIINSTQILPPPHSILPTRPHTHTRLCVCPSNSLHRHCFVDITRKRGRYLIVHNTTHICLLFSFLYPSCPALPPPCPALPPPSLHHLFCSAFTCIV